MVVTAQDRVRDALFDMTAAVPNEGLAGVMFAVGLVLTDHAFNLSEGVVRWFRT